MSPEEFRDRLNKICKPLPGSIPYSYNYTLTVKKNDIGKTILALYTEKFKRFPIAYWKEIISKNQLLVNGNIVDEHYTLSSGQITSRLVHNITEPDVSTEIKLIYLDDDIIVLDKPSPLPTSASGRFIKNTLLHLVTLTIEIEKLYSVHRIDANTTGLIVFALNKASAKDLIQQFQTRTITKTYLAAVEGLFTDNTIVNQSISKNTSSAGSRTTITGSDSTTHIKCLKNLEHTSLLEVKPETGRTNQIRLHLASIGHPIIGDIGYKDLEYFKKNPMTYQKDQLFLHAWKLSFKHPRTKKSIDLVSAIPTKYTKFT